MRVTHSADGRRSISRFQAAESGLPARQQRGRHGLDIASGRMHPTHKREATRPPCANSLQQQARFDTFVHKFKVERPHQALEMRCPGESYTPAPRAFQGLSELTCPFHDSEVLVTHCGRICMHRKKVSMSTVMAGQTLGIKEVDDGTWPFNFMHFNLEQKTLQTAGAPNRNSSARVGPSAASHGYSCGNVTGRPCGATAASIGTHTIRIENSQGTPGLLARVSRTDSLLHAGKKVSDSGRSRF